MSKKQDISYFLDCQLKHKDATVQDVIKYVTSPSFCQVPWDTITMSVSKGEGTNPNEKRSIVHIHRASTGKRNIFDIKFHNCRQINCEHKVCSKKCLKFNSLSNKKFEQEKKKIKTSKSVENMKKSNKNCYSKKLSSHSLTNAYNNFIEKVKLPSRNKLLSSNHLETQERSYYGKFNDILKKISLQSGNTPNDIKINNKEIYLKNENNKKLNDKKKSKENNKNETKQMEGIKPSCTLHIINNGRKKALHFDLHPAVEMFLLKAINKIEAESKVYMEKNNRKQKGELDKFDKLNKELQEKNKKRYKTEYYYSNKLTKLEEGKDEENSSQSSQAIDQEIKYTTDESDYTTESIKEISQIIVNNCKSHGEYNNCSNRNNEYVKNNLSKRNIERNKDSSNDSRLRSSLMSFNSTNRSGIKKCVHFSDESKDSEIEVSEIDYERSSRKNSSPTRSETEINKSIRSETEKSKSTDNGTRTSIKSDNGTCRSSRSENESSRRIRTDYELSSSNLILDEMSRTKSDGDDCRSIRNGTSTSIASENEIFRMNRTENEVSSENLNINEISRTKSDSDDYRSTRNGTSTIASENETFRMNRTENEVKCANININEMNKTKNDSDQYKLTRSGTSTSNGGENETFRRNRNENEVSSENLNIKEVNNNKSVNNEDFKSTRNISSDTEGYKSNKNDIKTCVIRTTNGNDENLNENMTNKTHTNEKRQNEIEFDIKPVKEKICSDSSCSVKESLTPDLKSRSSQQISTKCFCTHGTCSKEVNESTSIETNKSSKEDIIKRCRLHESLNIRLLNYKDDFKLQKTNYIPPYSTNDEPRDYKRITSPIRCSYNTSSFNINGSSYKPLDFNINNIHDNSNFFNMPSSFFHHGNEQRNVFMNPFISNESINPICQNLTWLNFNNSRGLLNKNNETLFKRKSLILSKCSEENVCYKNINQFDKYTSRKNQVRKEFLTIKTTPSKFNFEEENMSNCNVRKFYNSERGDIPNKTKLKSEKLEHPIFKDFTSSPSFSDSSSYYSSLGQILDNGILPIFNNTKTKTSKLDIQAQNRINLYDTESENFTSSSSINLYNNKNFNKSSEPHVKTVKSILKATDKEYSRKQFTKESKNKIFPKVHFEKSKDNFKFNKGKNFEENSSLLNIKEKFHVPFICKNIDSCENVIKNQITQVDIFSLSDTSLRPKKCNKIFENKYTSDNDVGNASFKKSISLFYPEINSIKEKRKLNSLKYINMKKPENMKNKKIIDNFINEKVEEEYIKPSLSSATSNGSLLDSLERTQKKEISKYNNNQQCLKYIENKNYSKAKSINIQNDYTLIKNSKRTLLENFSKYSNKEEADDEEQLQMEGYEDEDEREKHVGENEEKGDENELSEEEEKKNQKRKEFKEVKKKSKDFSINFNKTNKKMYTYGMSSDEYVEFYKEPSSVSLEANEIINFFDVENRSEINSGDDNDANLSELSYMEIQEYFDSENNFSDSDLSKNWMTEKSKKKERTRKKILRRKERNKSFEDITEIPPFLKEDTESKGDSLSRTMAEDNGYFKFKSNLIHESKKKKYSSTKPIRETIAFNNEERTEIEKKSTNAEIVYNSKPFVENEFKKDNHFIRFNTRNSKSVITILPKKLPKRARIERYKNINVDSESGKLMNTNLGEISRTFEESNTEKVVGRNISLEKKTSDIFSIKETVDKILNLKEITQKVDSDLYLNERKSKLITDKISPNPCGLYEKPKKLSEDLIHRNGISSHPLSYSEKKKYMKEIIKKAEDLRKLGNKNIKIDAIFNGDQEKRKRILNMENYERNFVESCSSDKNEIIFVEKQQRSIRMERRFKPPRIRKQESMKSAFVNNSKVEVRNMLSSNSKSKMETGTSDSYINGWFQDPTLNPQNGFSPNMSHL